MKTNNYPDTVKNIILASVTCFVLTLAASGQSMKDVIFDEPCNVSATMTTISRDFDKSEFETEKQYIDRINKLLATTKNISNKRPLNEIVFFYRDVANYDAEAQAFKFDVSGIYLDDRIVTRAKRRFHIAMYQRSYGRWSPDILAPTLPRSLPMPPEQARKVKPALAVAVYGMAVGGKWDNFSSELWLLPSRVVVFNQTKGEVYSDETVLTSQQQFEKRLDEIHKQAERLRELRKQN